MDKLKSKKGYSLVEVVIALSVIIVVSATALTVILYSITLRHAEINKSEAQNFAENVVECFKAANQNGLTAEAKKAEFFRLVEFAEGATFEQADPHFPGIYTYTSETKKFIVGINISYSDFDENFNNAADLTVEVIDKKGSRLTQIEYRVGQEPKQKGVMSSEAE